VWCVIWRVWRYQRGNQNSYIEDEQTTQWSKEKVQKDTQRSTKHTYKTKDWVARTPLKTGGELRCSGRVSSSCSTSDTRRVNLVIYFVMIFIPMVKLTTDVVRYTLKRIWLFLSCTFFVVRLVSFYIFCDGIHSNTVIIARILN